MMDAPYPHAYTNKTAQHEDAGRPVRKVLVSVGVPSFSVRLLTSFGPLTLLSALAEAKLEAVCEQDVRSCLFSLRSIANL